MDEREAFEAGYNVAFEKAFKWIKENIHYDENGDGNMEWVVYFGDEDLMHDNFKAIMSH